MTPIFTTSQVKDLDRYTIENEPIASIDLVERAATVFFHEFTRHFSRQARIFVFAGQGNNGADALAVARLLADESFKVETYLFNPTNQLSPECDQNKMRLLTCEGVEFVEVRGAFEPPVLGENDIVIDGLFGSGLNRPLSGGFAAVVNYINQSGATVVSIDIPSGLFGEDNSRNDPQAIIRADMTLTFGFPKLAFLLRENEAYVGEWKMLDIGLHQQAIRKTETPYSFLDEEDVADMYRPRERFAHKGDYGHALLIAGSRGKIGASLLSARSCLRSGAGLLTVHLPQRGEQILQTAFPEAMLSFDPHSERFTHVPELGSYSAVGVGPGIGLHLETASAFERLLERWNKSLVIDADALNIISSNRDLYKKIPLRSILTPHPKEFDRLAGESNNGFERLQKARSFAAEYGVYVVLKGAYTAICSPEEKVRFNPTGNPGMATAGSGDVLTGVLLGLLSQQYTPEEAAVLGVYLHGLAGDLASAQRSPESLVAGDITELLGKAFRQLSYND